MKKQQKSVLGSQPSRPINLKKAAPVRSTPAAPPRLSHPAWEGDIRLRAYLKWEAAGKPCGDGVSFWLEAEKELRSLNPQH